MLNGSLPCIEYGPGTEKTIIGVRIPMENSMPRIRDIAPGDTIKTVLIVTSAVQKQAKNGPFWTLELKDATGSLEARIWSPLSQTFKEIPENFIAEVEGRAERYRDQIQLSVTSLRPIPEHELPRVDMSLLVPSSRVDPHKLFEELQELCRNVFTYQPWFDLVMDVLKDPEIRNRLLVAPAACSVHHAWVGGLLEHTLGVTRLCLGIADQYPELDRQALATGAIFHDIGKLWELSGGLCAEYTNEGRLLGHISLGLAHIDAYLASSSLTEDLKLHLRHLILSHHGQREFGSPCLPQTPEALVLHYADNLDAKLAQCRVLLKELPAGRWSAYQKTLERNIFHPVRTPESALTRHDAASQAKQQDAPEQAQAAPFLSEPFMTEILAEKLAPCLAENTQPCPVPPEELDALFPSFDDAPDDTPPWDLPSPADFSDSGLFPLDEAVPDPLPEEQMDTPLPPLNAEDNTTQPDAAAQDNQDLPPAAGTAPLSEPLAPEVPEGAQTASPEENRHHATKSKTEQHNGARQCSLL